MACSTSFSHPFLGGSRTILFPCIPSFISLGNTSSDFPSINSAFFILFKSAFSFASSIAAFTISTPYTFFAFSAIYSDIVPIPQ